MLPGWLHCRRRPGRLKISQPLWLPVPLQNLGVLPLLGDRNVPGTLYTLAAALLAAGPAAVYFLPDDSTGLGGCLVAVCVRAFVVVVVVRAGSGPAG